jgi:cell division septation protein DedD
MLAPPPSPAKAKSFPYSIYLGSFKKEEALQNAVRIFREKGLSPFLVRMDLGEKGVWLRVFSGHFENQEQAEAWIKKNQIADAETKNTRYAVLLGEYSSKQEAEARVRALENSGCHPYVIGVNQASLRIYSGAYYRMEDAEKELAWLAPKGVKGRIVER